MFKSNQHPIRQEDSHSARTGYLAVIIAAVILGSIPVLAKPVLSNNNPLFIASLVYLLGAVFASAIPNKTRFSDIKSKDWFLILSVVGAGAIVAPIMYFEGLSQTTASNTVVISNSEYLFTIIFSIALFKEKHKPLGYIAIAMVLSGVLVVSTNLQFSNFVSGLNQGNWLVLASMGFWSLDNIISKIVIRRVNVQRLVQLKMLIGGASLILVVFFLKIPMYIDISELPDIIFLGIAGFGASLYFFLHSLKRIGTVKTMLLSSTAAVFGLLFAFLFLQEKIGISQMFAVAVMILGIYLIEKKDSHLPQIQR